MAELKVQVKQLEQALRAETKRRVDATTQFDQQARQAVQEMEDRLRQQLAIDNKAIDERLDRLQHRIAALEGRWEQESTAQVEWIQQKADGICQTLEDMQEAHDEERRARLKREGRLLAQVEDHGRHFEERWETERKERLESIQSITNRLEAQASNQSEKQASFHGRVELELQQLQQELQEEQEERQAQDEEIVAALNRYTQQLQHSLSILSSD